MRIYHKQIKKNWLRLIVFLLVSLGIVGALLSWVGNYNADQLTERFEAYLKRNKMTFVKQEVSNRVDEIKFDLDRIIGDEEDKVKQATLRTANILSNDQSLDNAEDQEVYKELSLAKLDLLAKKDLSFSYFAVEPSGTVIYSSEDNNLEGTNLLEEKDDYGEVIGSEIMEALNTSVGRLSFYYWPRENSDEMVLKYAYSYYVDSLGYIIAASGYADDALLTMKEEAFYRMQSYYEGQDNYIFIVDYDGNTLVHSDHGKIGTNLNSIKDLDNVSLQELFMDDDRRNDGFIDYRYLEADEIKEQLVYISMIDELEIYVGAGFFVDEMQADIDLYKKEFTSRNFYYTLIIQLLLCLIVIVSGFFIRKNIELQKGIIKQEDAIYEVIFRLTDQGIIIISNNGQIVFENTIAKHMIGESRRSEPFFEVIDPSENKENHVYVFENSVGIKHYLKIEEEQIAFKGQGCTLKILNDITESYIREHELVDMAFKDPLTNLYNRRKLEQDFHSVFIQMNRTYGIIAIIDLDKFKDVNDKYGHNIGDDVLKLFGKVCLTRLREADNVYRYGGEEFAIMINQIMVYKAVALISSINRLFAAETMETLGFEVTFSAGVVAVDEQEKKLLSEYIEEADNLLYKAKEKGRNCIEYKPFLGEMK